MITKFMNSIKSVFVFCAILFSVIACENDFEDVGVSLVDNNLFNTKDSIFEVIAYNVNVDSSRVDGLLTIRGLYNLGIYETPNFGLLNASIAAQVGSNTEIDFGLNPVIDTVILDIPYFSTRESEDNSDGTPNFTLDSILGNQDFEYNLKVSRLATFLNILDPNDITKVKKYYSDETYTGLTELYSGSFKPNKNDTVLYVNRNLFDGEESIDTIQNENLSPSIKLPLDKTEIERIFLTEASETNLESFENFINYFRGILIEPEGIEDGSLMSLQTSNIAFNIYYTNEILTSENGIDLNGDGDTTDENVPVKTKQTLSMSLLGIITGNYARNYSGSAIESYLNTPNIINGEEKLFIQGSAGSNAEIDIQIDLDEIRAKNWLINGAILDLYVEDDEDNRIVPEQLYLFNADYNSLLIDIISEGTVNGIGGFLVRDEDTGNPLRYRFSITDYMSELLKSNSTGELSKLGLKVYHPIEAPVSALDTLVKDYSWRSKGVVLKGNKLIDEERLKLTIYYTEENN